MYQERFYRAKVSSLHRLEVAYKESDLLICAGADLEKQSVSEIVKKYYLQIEEYCKKRPEFLSSLSPLSADPAAPAIVADMLAVSHKTGIGPFAAVAGAVALYTGNELLSGALRGADELIIENGGDIFLNIKRDVRIGVYLGDDFSSADNLVLRVKERGSPFGIASSSALIGHSLNFGSADLLTLIAKDPILADGFVTALSNRVKKKTDAELVLGLAKENPDIYGILIAFQGEIYIWGEIELDG